MFKPVAETLFHRIRTQAAAYKLHCLLYWQKLKIVTISITNLANNQKRTTVRLWLSMKVALKVMQRGKEETGTENQNNKSQSS